MKHRADFHPPCLTEEEAVPMATARSSLISDANVTADSQSAAAESVGRKQKLQAKDTSSFKTTGFGSRSSTQASKSSTLAGETFFYVIYKCPRDPDLVGIHEGLWSDVKASLPRGTLDGSGIPNCKKFSTFDAAKLYFRANSTLPAAEGITWYRYRSALILPRPDST